MRYGRKGRECCRLLRGGGGNKEAEEIGHYGRDDGLGKEKLKSTGRSACATRQEKTASRECGVRFGDGSWTEKFSGPGGAWARLGAERRGLRQGGRRGLALP